MERVWESVDTTLQRHFGVDYQQTAKQAISTFYTDPTTGSYDVLKLALTCLAIFIPLALCFTQCRRPDFEKTKKEKYKGSSKKKHQRSKEVSTMTQSKQEDSNQPRNHPRPSSSSREDTIPLKKALAMSRKGKKKKHHHTPDTPYYLFTLKGHSELVTCIAMSADGQYFASSSSDRTIQLYRRDAKYQGSPFRTLHTQLDTLSSMTMSADGKTLACVEEYDRKASLISIPHSGKKSWEIKSNFSTEHKDKIGRTLYKVLSGSGHPTLLTMGTKSTEVRAFSREGAHLHSIKSNQLCNMDLAVSHDGRLACIAAKTPEAKVWNIEGLGEGKKPTKILAASGHKHYVVSACFSKDSKKLVTIDADNTWYVWDINVRWEVDEDPHLLSKHEGPPSAQRIFVSDNDENVVVVANTGVFVYSLRSGHPVGSFKSEGEVIDSAVSQDGDVVILLAAREKHARVYAVPGGKAAKQLQLANP